jgi:hypothetical protein
VIFPAGLLVPGQNSQAFAAPQYRHRGDGSLSPRERAHGPKRPTLGVGEQLGEMPLIERLRPRFAATVRRHVQPARNEHRVNPKSARASDIGVDPVADGKDFGFGHAKASEV